MEDNTTVIKIGDNVLMHSPNTYSSNRDLTIDRVYKALEVYHDHIVVHDDKCERHTIGVDSVKRFDANLHVVTTTFTTHKIGSASVIVTEGRVSVTGFLSTAQFKAIAEVL